MPNAAVGLAGVGSARLPFTVVHGAFNFKNEVVPGQLLDRVRRDGRIARRLSASRKLGVAETAALGGAVWRERSRDGVFPTPTAGAGENRNRCDDNRLFLVLPSTSGQEPWGGRQVTQEPATQEPGGPG